jgi:glycosidase
MPPLFRIVFFRFLLALVASIAFRLPLYADPPAVEKVEPPHWWIGSSMRSVRLLVRGSHLNGAQVRKNSAGVSAGKAKVSADGRYLFVDLTIASNATIGEHPLIIQTVEGQTTAPFRLEEPLPRAGRFQGFSADDVIYLALPDRFSDGDSGNNDPAKSRGLYNPAKTRSYHGGDFAGIHKRLPYLKSLGITALWMTPIYDNADHANPARVYDNQQNIDYHGYAAIDYYGAEEHFGTISELKALVDAAHALGIKVIQDQVCNHVGEFHPWAASAPTPTWLNGTKSNHVDCDWNITNLMNPDAAPQTQTATLDGWFAGILPDMNQNDPEVAQYLIQNSLWWIGTIGFDGIRQDTIPYVSRRFWRSWTEALKREYPRLTILGEVLDGNPALTAFYQGGRKGFDGINTGIDTVFDYPSYFALRNAFAGDNPNLSSIQKILASDWLYPRPEILVNFMSLHDQPCFMSLPGATYARLQVAQTYMFTVRGIPMLYYGDEIGLPGSDDPHNRRHFPGGFPGDTRDAYTSAGRTPDEQRIFDHVRRLTTLHAKLPALRRGKMVTLYQRDQQFVYARTLPGQKPVLIALNLSNKPATIEVPVGVMGLTSGDKLRPSLSSMSSDRDVTIVGGVIKLILTPTSSDIFVAL